MKIKFSLLCIPVIVLAFTVHLEKLLFYVFCMISIHEMSHVLVAKLFHFQVKQITILPIGLSAEITDLGYHSFMKECLVIMAGPLSHFIMPFFLISLFNLNVISAAFFSYLMMFNRSILLFNSLPIFPLDGGRVLNNLLHLFLPYKKATYLTIILSCIFLTISLYQSIFVGVSGLMVCIILYFQLYQTYKNKMIGLLKFYYYRFTNSYKGYNKYHAQNDLYRFYNNYIYKENRYLNEKEWLKTYFTFNDEKTIHKFKRK